MLRSISMHNKNVWNLLIKHFVMHFGDFIERFFVYNSFFRYNVRWYVAPLYVQRMTLFLLQNRSKDFTLSAGLFIASIENFAAVYIRK